MYSEKLSSAIVAVILVLGTSAITSAAEGTSLKFNDFVKEVSMKGDFRLRYENRYRNDQHNKANASSSRSRHIARFRFRLGLDFKLPSNVVAKFKLASGTGEQVSTNQSFDNLSTQKGLWIDQAYLLWGPLEGLKLAGGRMNNPFWTPYTSDVIWDGDFNPEGTYLKYERIGPLNSKIFVNALQMVADEDSSGTQDQWMFGQQIGAETLLFEESKLTAAVAVHEWVNERTGNFGQPTVAKQPGNRVNASSTTLNEFRVLEYTGEYQTALRGIPLSFQGTFVVNNKSRLLPAENHGFQYGAIIGKAGKPKTWEAAYFYKRVEADATVSDIADSDFGVAGGTNRKGHIFWVAYNPNKIARFQLKQFVTKAIEPSLMALNEANAGNRTQLDMVVKF